MHSHDVLLDFAYPVIAVAGNGAQQLRRHGTPDAVDVDIPLGSTVLGIRGETIGTIAEVYVDNQTGQSDWATVSIGGHRCVIPLSEARVDGTTVWVVVTAEQVRAAPYRDPATALTVEDKRDLNRHFGVTDPQRPSARRVPPKPRALGEAARAAALHWQVNRVDDHGQNPSRARAGAVKLCPPDAVRC